MPKRNDIHIAKFSVIFNDIPVRDVFDLPMALFPAADCGHLNRCTTEGNDCGRLGSGIRCGFQVIFFYAAPQKSQDNKRGYEVESFHYSARSGKIIWYNIDMIYIGIFMEKHGMSYKGTQKYVSLEK